MQEVDTGVRHSSAESAEILDEMVTRSRGEIKHINSPKVTSSSGTPTTDLRALQSEKAYSPRIAELRREQSPRLDGRRTYGPRSEARPS